MNDHIQQFWAAQAEKHGTSHAASWGDLYAISLEIETIGPYVRQGADVLDVGCANGYSTLHHLARNPRRIVGVDFIPSMVEAARKNQAAVPGGDRAEFRVGDVRQLPFGDASFDLVYTTRTLINLATWDEQKKGITECVRVCRPGGVVLFSEAFWEPLMLLNAIRSLKALPALVEHDFNRYLKKSYLEEFLRGQALPYTVVDFSSVYYLGSRFLRELVTNPADYPGYSNPINKLFYEMEKEFSGGGFGIQQAYVVQR